jgi:hypothetical protein
MRVGQCVFAPGTGPSVLGKCCPEPGKSLKVAGQAACSGRQVGCGARQVGCGARQVGCGARQVGCGARQVGCGARQASCGARRVSCGARQVSSSRRHVQRWARQVRRLRQLSVSPHLGAEFIGATIKEILRAPTDIRRSPARCVASLRHRSHCAPHAASNSTLRHGHGARRLRGQQPPSSTSDDGEVIARPGNSIATSVVSSLRHAIPRKALNMKKPRAPEGTRGSFWQTLRTTQACASPTTVTVSFAVTSRWRRISTANSPTARMGSGR